VASDIGGDGGQQVAHLRGRCLNSAQSGDWAGMLVATELGLQRLPGDPELLFFRGLALRRMGRNDEALAVYEAALLRAPEHPDLLGNYGNALKDAGRSKEALACYERALRQAPGLAWLHINRANLLAETGSSEGAVAGYEEALRIDPGRGDAWCGRGRALLDLGRAKEALDNYERARALDSGDVEAVAGAGHAWFELGRPEHAIAAFEQALTLDESDADALNGLAMAVQRTGDLDRAERLFSRALTLDPGFAEARYNRALLRLSMRRFGEAWPDYEGRIGLPSFREHLRVDSESVATFLSLPRWDGRVNSRTTLGVWAEQGLGDQVLFSMLLPELQQRGQPFVYEVDRRLLAAYRRVFPDVHFVALSNPVDAALAGADQALFCGSLPGLLRPPDDPASRQWQPALRADAAKAAHYSARMGRQARVALSWRSARAGWVGRDKSADLAALAPLLQVPGVQWVDIQYGDTAEERSGLASTLGVELLHFDDLDYRDDLDEVLAIIEACDLVIATSNATAHLAGALGKATWLLQAGGPPFHYWEPGPDGRCAWYPQVAIEAVPDYRDWNALARKVALRLAQWLEQRPA
jgi:tetratricopeptide (TPR) repeat protein